MGTALRVARRELPNESCRMRVALHAGQLDQPVPGGIGRYVEGLLRHLPDAGVAVERFGGGRVIYDAQVRPAQVVHDVRVLLSRES